MFFGFDTAIAIYALVSGAEASAATVQQYHDRPSYGALEAAWAAVERAGLKPEEVGTLAVIDFTKPSYLKRMEIYRQGECRPARYLCAHGKNSGDIYAVSFSNRSGSEQTSLGLYRVGAPYRGSFGPSLVLHGLEEGINDKAEARRIVLHSAWYVSQEVILENIIEGLGPRVGRSQGCPAVPAQSLEEVCHLLTEGTFLYIHGHVKQTVAKGP